MVLVCLPSDALLQHLPSYLGFSYLGRGVSCHGCSSKLQLLLLTLDKGYLLTDAPPNLGRGVAPSALLRPHSNHSLDVGLLLSATAPDLGRGVAPLGRSCADAAWHCLEKSVCRSGSNSLNWTWNNRLVPNRKRSTLRLYIVTLLTSLLCRVHHEKRWAGRSTSWNQDCREKYQ